MGIVTSREEEHLYKNSLNNLDNLREFNIGIKELKKNKIILTDEFRKLFDENFEKWFINDSIIFKERLKVQNISLTDAEVDVRVNQRKQFIKNTFAKIKINEYLPEDLINFVKNNSEGIQYIVLEIHKNFYDFIDKNFKKGFIPPENDIFKLINDLQNDINKVDITEQDKIKAINNTIDNIFNILIQNIPKEILDKINLTKGTGSDNLLFKSLKILAYAKIMSAGLVSCYFSGNFPDNIKEFIPKIDRPNNDNIIYVLSLLSLQISGCYMIINNGYEVQEVKLEGCNNWYNNLENQMYCGCSETTDSKETPDCTNAELCKYPFCLNQNSCFEQDAEKCIINDEKIENKLYKCNKYSASDEGYIYYTYNFYPPTSISDTLNFINFENSEDSNSNFILILIPIIIMIILVIIYTFYQMSIIKKNKKISK